MESNSTAQLDENKASLKTKKNKNKKKKRDQTAKARQKKKIYSFVDHSSENSKPLRTDKTPLTATINFCPGIHTYAVG
jgi:sRNA-binding protein